MLKTVTVFGPSTGRKLEQITPGILRNTPVTRNTVNLIPKQQPFKTVTNNLATHGVHLCCRALMVSPWAGACCTGVVVVHVTAMSATVVLVVETLDWCGRLAAWVLVVNAISAAVCAAT